MLPFVLFSISLDKSKFIMINVMYINRFSIGSQCDYNYPQNIPFVLTLVDYGIRRKHTLGTCLKGRLEGAGKIDGGMGQLFVNWLILLNELRLSLIFLLVNTQRRFNI